MPVFTVKGIELELPKALAVPRIVEKLEKGQYEGFEARAARKRVKPGHKVLELGGGMGYLGSVCSAITGGRNVVTVEANPDMVKVIRANLDRNGHEAATVLHGAVAGDDAEGETLVFRQDKAFWGSSIASESDGESTDNLVEVPLLKIGALLKQYTPDVVIMDIEGGEQHLFAEPWPKHVGFLMMELHPTLYPDETVRRIFDCMSASGMIFDTRVSSGSIVGFRRMQKAGTAGIAARVRA